MNKNEFIKDLEYKKSLGVNELGIDFIIDFVSKSLDGNENILTCNFLENSYGRAPKCSNCNISYNSWQLKNYKYCPNCGRKIERVIGNACCPKCGKNKLTSQMSTKNNMCLSCWQLERMNKRKSQENV